jgi:hypothetical protein
MSNVQNCIFHSANEHESEEEKKTKRKKQSIAVSAHRNKAGYELFLFFYVVWGGL